MADYVVKGIAPDMTLAGFQAVLRAAQSPVSDTDAAAVYAYTVARGFSPAALLAWFNHESGMGRNGWAATTHSWGNTRPPSLGAIEVGQYNQDTRAFYPLGRAKPWPPGRYLCSYANWIAGGVSTVARFFDHAPYIGKNSVAAIVPVWAPSTDGNDTAAYIAAVLADIQRFKETSMARIALASGHHNSSGGDAFEKAQTGPLCAAVASACRALGMDVRVVQPNDGLGTIAGSLDVVGNTVVGWANAGWVPDIFLECHTEGGGGTGVFAIYPDAAGDVDTDVRDKLGPLVAKAVGAVTGLGLGAGGDGVMSERQTGVGGDGFRLGIFRTTAPLAASTTRLIIEYGAHDKEPDLSIAKAAGFADKCGRATAAAFATFLGLPTQPGAGSVVEAPAAPLGPESVTAAINKDGNAIVTINFGGQWKSIKGYIVADAGVSGIGMDDATYHRSLKRTGFEEFVREGK